MSTHFYQSTIKLSCCLLVTSALLACGGSDSKAPASKVKVGKLVASSPVENVSYRTKTQSGTTKANGEFMYESGESVTFSIGKLTFPETPAKATVTPLDIAQTKDVKQPSVVNMLRLLETLDKDANPNNGIFITQAAEKAAEVVNFKQSVAKFEQSPAVKDLISHAGQDTKVSALVPADSAISNFEAQNTPIGKPADGVWLSANSPEILMLNKGAYVAAHLTLDAGFERGTFAADNGKITFNTSQNHDGDYLACEKPKGQTCSNVQDDYRLENGKMIFLNDDGTVSSSISKINFKANTIQGVWRLGNSNDFIFLPDNTFVAFQYTEENNQVGFEKGTYTLNGSSIIFKTTINNDGAALTCNVDKDQTCPSSSTWTYQLNGDNLSFTTSDDSVTLTRVF